MNNLKAAGSIQGANSIESLFNSLTEINTQLEYYKDLKEKVNKEIYSRFEDKINEKYKQKPDPFGVVSFEEEGLKIKFDTPKNVSWDQDGLKTLLEEGAPVKAKYEVSETVFKTMEQSGKDAFMPYRTVKPGKVTIEIERKDV